MANTQSRIDLLEEQNSKLVAKITELREKNAVLLAENIEIKADNVKLKQALEKYEARFVNLEQKDKEKTSLIAKLDDDIKEIKQSSCQPIYTKPKSLEEKEVDRFLDSKYRESVSKVIIQSIKVEIKSCSQLPRVLSLIFLRFLHYRIRMFPYPKQRNYYLIVIKI